MKINRALLSPVDDQFESEFKTLKDAPGLIIDLRGISGGDIKDVGLKIANYFFLPKCPSENSSIGLVRHPGKNGRM